MIELPKAIGPYEVLERVSGAGLAYAEVFKARDRHGTIVCVKRLHPSVADSVAFVDRFEDEIDTASRLDHINLVRVSKSGYDDGHYFVMEWMDGMDLGTLLRWLRAMTGGRGVLPPELVAYIGVECCRGLAYLHRSEWGVSDAGEPARTRGPVVHSDISPSNVLLSRQGFVKLADFGLAHVLSRTGMRTMAEAEGKPMYWSPEQFADDEDVGVETDLFSLGLVLWRALVGSQPYAERRPRGHDLNAWVAKRTLAGDRRSVIEAAPQTPPVLARVIEGLLQPLEKRIGTAAELFETLRAIEPLDGHAQLGALVAQAQGREAP